MKKLALSTFALFGTLSVHAFPGSFYLGAGMGAAFHQGSYSFGQTTPGTNVSGLSAQESRTGTDLSLLAGYLLPLNETINLLLQIDYQSHAGTSTPFTYSSTLTGPVTTTLYRTTQSNKFSYGFSLKPAMQINPYSSVFLNLGWRRGKIEDTITATAGSVPAPTTTTTVKRSNYRNGIDLGIGTQLTLASQLYLQLEVYQTHYQNKVVLPSSSSQSFDLSAKNRLNHAMVNILWQFDE
jgi:opacity protein-like surface antigen